MRKWVTRMREKHVDDVSRTHTYIQKYSDFLVYTIKHCLLTLTNDRASYCQIKLFLIEVDKMLNSIITL